MAEPAFHTHNGCSRRGAEKTPSEKVIASVFVGQISLGGERSMSDQAVFFRTFRNCWSVAVNNHQMKARRTRVKERALTVQDL
jgi:hypothetical protein